MTDPRGTSAGWRTAVVLAPAAAAALAVATGWAVAHPPEGSASTASAPTAAAPAADPAVDHTDIRLHRQALAAQARVVALTKALHRLRARTDALRSAPLPGAGGGGSVTVSSSGGGSVSVAAPPVAAAPAPATHTSTGSS